VKFAPKRATTKRAATKWSHQKDVLPRDHKLNYPYFMNRGHKKSSFGLSMRSAAKHF